MIQTGGLTLNSKRPEFAGTDSIGVYGKVSKSSQKTWLIPVQVHLPDWGFWGRKRVHRVIGTFAKEPEVRYSCKEGNTKFQSRIS